MRPISKAELIRGFQLITPVGYHAESLHRVAHLKSLSLRKASVLIGFVERPTGLNVVLTKRAAHLKHHPGQISFPGGKYEESDGTLYQTAMRETREEIGIQEDQIEILGQLPELVTVSKFAVTPVLAFISPDYKTLIDANEVEEVLKSLPTSCWIVVNCSATLFKSKLLTECSPFHINIILYGV